METMKVVSKLLLTIETDIETGEVKLLNREVINDDIKPKKKSSSSGKIDSNPEPIVTLSDNKLILTKGAAEMLNVSPDDKVAVKYDKNKSPIIGSDSNFGTQTGNRLTKSLTVSYRGDKYDRLIKFGTEFKLKPTDQEGIFSMVGNKVDTKEVPEELVNINNELESLDSLDEEFTSDFTL